jgi:hypothetical protein
LVVDATHPGGITDKGQDLGNKDDNQYFESELNGKLVRYFVDKERGISFSRSFSDRLMPVRDLYECEETKID